MRILDAHKLSGKWRANIKFFLNGKDVSHQAFWTIAPSKPGRLGLGIVRLFKLNRDGLKYFDRKRNAPAQTIQVGLVRWEYKDQTRFTLST